MKWKRPRGKSELTGLGDLVAVAAQPIARGVDALFGTDIEHCEGCKQRQADWNKAVPFNAEEVLPEKEKSKTIIVPCLGCGRK